MYISYTNRSGRMFARVFHVESKHRTCASLCYLLFMISTYTKCNSFDVYICMLVCVCSKGPLFWEIKYLYCIVLYCICPI